MNLYCLLNGEIKMADCEMCGKKNQPLVKTKIENTTMYVCSICARYGTSISEHRSSPTNASIRSNQFERKQTPEKMVVSNASVLIKEARRNRQLNHKQFAQLLNEKESVLTKIESNQMPISIALAKKIEKTLHIRLLEDEVQINVDLPQHDEGSQLTMEQLILSAMKKKK